MLPKLSLRIQEVSSWCFNRHPPLGVNATQNETHFYFAGRLYPFQWAPTLGGECYRKSTEWQSLYVIGFNGHPPLGVNATGGHCAIPGENHDEFQWASTLGGECYRSASITARRVSTCFNGHPPLGVNATLYSQAALAIALFFIVSMGTHP